MAAPISSLSGDIWPLICEYLNASDICELQCSGYRPFVKFLSYSNLHDVNLRLVFSRPFVWPPWLSPSSIIRSISITSPRYVKTLAWDALDIHKMPQMLTSLTLFAPRSHSFFSAPLSTLAADLQLKIDETFPVLAFLSLEEPTSTRSVPEYVIPRSLTSFVGKAHPQHRSPSWPDHLLHLDLCYSTITEPWIPNLPSTLQTLSCSGIDMVLLPQLTARVPGLKTLERRISYPSRETMVGGTLGGMLPTGLTSLQLKCIPRYGDYSVQSFLADLPPQLRLLNLGPFARLKADDVLLIPRTVTDLGFIIRTVSCLEAVPDQLLKLTYHAKSLHECSIGAILPQNLTFLDLTLTRLPDSEYRLLPASITDLSLNCLNDISAKYIGHLKELQRLSVHGGKLSRVGFLRLPRSLAFLSLQRSFILGSDAFHDSLPNLQTLEYVADPVDKLVLEPGVFQRLPLSLDRLHLLLGPSHSRFPWTNELSRLTQLTYFQSLGGPYDANLKGLAMLPPSLTSIDCYLSWTFTTEEFLRMPKMMCSIKLKSPLRHTVDPALTAAFTRRAYFWHLTSALKRHHPLYGKKFDS